MEEAIKTEKRWWEVPSGKLLVLDELAHTLVSQTHQATHLSYAACSQVNAAPRVFRQKPPGIQLKGTLPLEHLGVDITDMKPHQHNHYLLVMVYAFSGWVEAFPTWTERASGVARCLLREIVPRLGFPTSTGSDNGPAFVADLAQQVSKTLNIKWKLHAAYRPRALRWWNEPTGLLKRLSKWIRDCLLLGGPASNGSAQTQDDPTVPRLFSI